LGFRKPLSQTEYASDTENPYAYGAYGLRQTLVLTDFTDIKDRERSTTLCPGHNNPVAWCDLSSKWNHNPRDEPTLCNGIYWHGGERVLSSLGYFQNPIELADSKFKPLNSTHFEQLAQANRVCHDSSGRDACASYNQRLCAERMRVGKNRLFLGYSQCLNDVQLWNNKGMVAELYCDA
jgi:hypothetical protein